MLNLKANKQKNPGTKHPGNPGHYEKTKSTNNRYGGRRRNSHTHIKGTENILNRIIEKKKNFTNQKKGSPYQDKRST